MGCIQQTHPHLQPMLRGLCRRRGRKAVRVSDDGRLQGKVSTRLNLTDKHVNSEAVVAYLGPKQVQVAVSVIFFLSFFFSVLYCFVQAFVILLVFCLLIIVFRLVFLWVWLCVCLFVFLFVFQRERRYSTSWVGIQERAWKSWGRGTLTGMYCMIKIDFQ